MRPLEFRTLARSSRWLRLHAKGVPGVQSEDRPSQRLLCVFLGTGVGAVGNSGQKLPLPTSWLGLGLW